jgi:RNA polymerase sigma factor (sigma-70 family)
VRVAYLVTGELTAAEDAAQQAFIKAYYALDRLRPDAPFRPWLLRITANEASNLRKAARRRAHREARALNDLLADGAAPSAESAALAGEQDRALHAALLGLRAEDRLIIGYRYLFELSEAETAEALGLARGTVKSRLARALGRLRERFREAYPLLVAAPITADFVRDGLADLAGPLPHQPVRDLADGVLGGLRTARETGSRPAGTRAARTPRLFAPVALALVVLVIMLLAFQPWSSRPPPPAAAPTGRQAIVYGGDLSVAERQEVAQLLGADPAGQDAQTVTQEELVGTLQAAGLPAAPGDAAISSVALTCLGPGQGLRVSTHHATRLPAAVYALALLTARPIAAAVVIAAPAARPVTGEAALVGALKIAASCQEGAVADPARVRLAYELLQRVTALADAPDDLNQAATTMLKATRTVVASQATDEATIGAILTRTADAEGLTIDAAQRGQVIALLRQLGGLDYGPYGGSYELGLLGPTDVELTPAGSGAQ